MKTEIDLRKVSAEELSLSHTCRTCLATNPDQQMTCIFETELTGDSTSVDIYELLLLLQLKVCISKDDGFPTKICGICLARLVAIEDFRKHCEKVQKYLQKNFVKQTVFQQSTPTKVDDFSESEHSNLDASWHDQTEIKSEDADHFDKHRGVTKPGRKSKDDADFSSDSDLDPSWEPNVDDKAENEGAKDSDKHTTGIKYKCRVCEKSFKYARCRLSHEKTHSKKTNKTTYLCNVCGKGFNHENSLNSHIKKHNTTEKYSCDICQKVFLMKGSLKTHLNVHSNVKAFQCEQCGKNFRQMGALNIHLALHNADRPYKCEFCKESYLRVRDLRRHRLVVHAQTELTVKSLDEQEDSGDQLPVKQEIPQKESSKKKSKNDLPYGCNLCSRTFKLPSSLASHIKTHSEERKFVCNECGVGFKKLAHLKMHVNGVHLRKKAYSCEVCNKSFARVGDRNVHMRSHTEEKPHQCSYCGRGFHLAKALRAHTRQHTGERPFVCIICNAGFTCHKTLTSHTRRQHAGDQQVLTKVDEIAQATLSGSQKETNGSSSLVVCKIDSQA
ncbi:zinc finger protein OZF isoform X2 [Aedes albopictus]|uniref:C2h2-type zn-finger protein n=1 Tax=Aedes albopictus TaxID=7160 RepID=A0ABM1Y6Y4_AEDAL